MKTLDWREYNFNVVPESEREFCYVYEYERERARLDKELAKRDKKPTRHSPIQFTLTGSVRPAIEMPGTPIIEAARKDRARPWLAIARAKRKRWIKEHRGDFFEHFFDSIGLHQNDSRQPGQPYPHAITAEGPLEEMKAADALPKLRLLAQDAESRDRRSKTCPDLVPDKSKSTWIVSVSWAGASPDDIARTAAKHFKKAVKAEAERREQAREQAREQGPQTRGARFDAWAHLKDLGVWRLHRFYADHEPRKSRGRKTRIAQLVAEKWITEDPDGLGEPRAGFVRNIKRILRRAEQKLRQGASPKSSL